MLAIGFLVAIVYMFNSTRKYKKVALDKGIESDDIILFTVSLWLYALPPLFTFLFTDSFSLLLALLFLTLYLPGIYFSWKLSRKLSTGFDFERKAGKEYAKVTWLGFAGIGLIIINLLFFSVRYLGPNGN